MTILDLIKQSAIALNIKEVLEDKSLVDMSFVDEEEVLSKNFAFKRLYELSKVVINEVASHAPEIAVEEKQSKDKKIDINTIDRLSKVISVKDKHGYIKCSVFNQAIYFDKDDTYTIEFERKPLTSSFLNTIEYNNGQIVEDIYFLGLNTYYCLAVGLFAEYNVYHKRYNERLNSIKNLKLFAMPCRSWHD